MIEGEAMKRIQEALGADGGHGEGGGKALTTKRWRKGTPGLLGDSTELQDRGKIKRGNP